MEWFDSEHSKIFGFWQHQETQRKKVDEIAKKLGIKNPKDWSSISASTFKKNDGGLLLSMYGGSLYRLLVNVYPGT